MWPTPQFLSVGMLRRVSFFKFLEVILSDDLKGPDHATHQHFYFLRHLQRARVSTIVLASFYRCAMESILTGCIISWYGSYSEKN